jgi:hypothetical protein
MGKSWASAVLVLLGTVPAAAVLLPPRAQPFSKQAALDTTAFTSPMVLIAKFAATEQSLWGKGEWFTTDDYLQLSRFTCDGVRLSGAVDASGRTTKPGLLFAARLRPDGLEEIKIRVLVWNPPHNKDKSVTVVLEVLEGEFMRRRVTIGPLDVEEGHTPQHGESSLLFPLDMLREPLTLRVTLTTANRLAG